MVGPSDGNRDIVGVSEGMFVGAFEGDEDGCMVGEELGFEDIDGSALGAMDTDGSKLMVGSEDGKSEGNILGTDEIVGDGVGEQVDPSCAHGLAFSLESFSFLSFFDVLVEDSFFDFFLASVFASSLKTISGPTELLSWCKSECINSELTPRSLFLAAKDGFMARRKKTHCSFILEGE